MTRALLTINFNGALCDNSRQSMRAAADRWGAEFIEWNERTAPKYAVHPACLPCAAFANTNADEAFILDADLVISSACPNPFETFIGSELIAVENGNRERFGDYEQIKGAERYEWAKLSSEDFRFSSLPWTEGAYWNSGVILARRRYHEAMFALALEVVQVPHGLGWNQQTPLNMAAAKLAIPVRLVSEAWNFIHPEDLSGFPRMNGSTYIWHFAGSPGREHVLPIIQWK